MTKASVHKDSQVIMGSQIKQSVHQKVEKEYDVHLPDESQEEVIAEMEMKIDEVELHNIKDDSHFFNDSKTKARDVSPKNQVNDNSYSFIVAPSKSILKPPTNVRDAKSTFLNPNDNTAVILEDIQKHKEHHRK